jgi:extracellular elastinolytic metalloproteinase
MARELDRRESSPPPRIENREEEIRALASEVSDRLPGAHRLRVASFDEATGGAEVVASESAPAEKGDYVRRALDHLQRISPALGLTAGQPAEYSADPTPQTASSGMVSVHVQQRHQGIPIFQAAEVVRFAPDGALQETVGASVPVAGDQEVAPALDVEEAVLAAARHVAQPDPDEEEVDAFGEPLPVQRVDLEGFEPRVVTSFADQADRRTVLDAGPFGEEIRAGIVWFPLGAGLRLAWEVMITMPESAGAYRTLVDAESGEILYCKQLIHSVAARVNVFKVDGAGAREVADCPLPLGGYALPLGNGLPAAFPEDWVETDRTVGNSVGAHLGAAGASLRGANQGGTLTFDPASATGDDQKVLNIFYYNCFMHDFFYLLGFDEASGNFQRDNFGRGGRAGDPVDARSHPGPVFGTANMATPPDGRRPIMNMGLVASTNRHTAFDSTVVFHEFTHGVTNRLVGGPLDDRALEAPQSGGMGEGWGDYVACSIHDVDVVGSWVVDRPLGIRGFRYDDQFPDGFGDLGRGRYTSSVHNVGEIWCATLLAMNRAIGKALGLQLVVDALKLSPANPSFLDMRDAILTALDAMLAAGQLDAAEHAGDRREIWRVFARFGMGVGARSNGAFLSGIVASSEVPEEAVAPPIDLTSEPDLEIPDRDLAGVRDAIEVERAGTAARVAVRVEIPHNFIGDLEVAITSPGGTRALLQQATGADPSDDLFRTWTSDDTQSLRALVGEAVEGTWELAVADLFRLDRGRLARWRLEIELA